MFCGVGPRELVSRGGGGGDHIGILEASLWGCQEWIRDGKVGDGETCKELL